MGLFITFEGLDGSGKSTQAGRLYEELVQQGVPVLLTREPGGTGISEQIRAILHSNENTDMLARTEVLLYSAARAQHVGEFIVPQLETERVVICDRYADSTLAYQGYGHGLNLSMLHTVTEFATGGVKPELTVYLDLTAEVSLSRRRSAFESAGGELNRMDRQAIEFYRRVRDGYLSLMAEEPQRWIRIDAEPTVEEVYREVRGQVIPFILRWLQHRPGPSERSRL